MRQFDIVENPSTQSRAIAPYFVVLQSHYLQPLDSVIVAPVVRDAERPITILDVPVEIADEALLLTIGELFSIRREHLRAIRSTLSADEEPIRRALERAFTDF